MNLTPYQPVYSQPTNLIGRLAIFAPIVDKMATHLAAQRRRSFTNRGPLEGCAYRGDDGAMCAVGCLFSNEAYVEDGEPENMPASQLFDADFYPHISAELWAAKPVGADDDDYQWVLGFCQTYHDKTPNQVERSYSGRLETSGHLSDAELAQRIAEDLYEVLMYQAQRLGWDR